MSSPGSPAVGDRDADRADWTRDVQDYAFELTKLHSAASDLQRCLNDIASRLSISVFDVRTRAKTLESYAAKSTKTKYENPRVEIEDCVGARVILYTQRDVSDFVEQLGYEFELPRPAQDMEREKSDGYSSRHLVVSSLAADGKSVHGGYRALSAALSSGRRAEIQVRTVAEHAWAAYSHDVKYKPGSALDGLEEKDRGRVDMLFVQAAGFRKSMDVLFDEINEIVLPVKATQGEPSPAHPAPAADAEAPSDALLTAISVADFSSAVSEFYGDYDPSDGEEVESAWERIGALVVDDPDEEEEEESRPLQTIDDFHEFIRGCLEESEFVEERMQYDSTPTQIRRFEDEVLAKYGDAYVATAQDPAAHKVLQLRLRRLRGKRLIYQILRDGEEATAFLTGANALRTLVRMVVDAFGSIDAANVDQVVTDDLTEEFRGRYKDVKTKFGKVRVNANMNREWIDLTMRRLLDRQDPEQSVLSVERAGEPL